MEFSFIDLTFVPVGKPDVSEYKGGMHDDLPATYEPGSQVICVEKPAYQSTPASAQTNAPSSSNSLPSNNLPIGSSTDIAMPRITIPPQPPPPPPTPKRIELSAILKAKKSR